MDCPLLGEYFPIQVWVSSEEKKQLFLIPAFLLEIEFSGWRIVKAQASGMVFRCGMLFPVSDIGSQRLEVQELKGDRREFL